MCCSATDLEPASIDTLLIGYGNTLRTDDGVGPVVVDLIRHSPGQALAAGVVCRSELQLTPELAAIVARAGRVIFIDASVALPVGRVSVTRIAAQSMAACLGHQFSPPQILELARLAFGAVPRAWIVGVGVKSLAIGQGLTTSVAATARRLARHLRYHLPPVGQPAEHWILRNTSERQYNRCRVADASREI
ncbi:MAG: hydrogenase maturation protease [Phycisphaerae bacterium]|nr:hydrogenase maturation protease [Phycisphaerae bacterium]